MAELPVLPPAEIDKTLVVLLTGAMSHLPHSHFLFSEVVVDSCHSATKQFFSSSTFLPQEEGGLDASLFLLPLRPSGDGDAVPRSIAAIGASFVTAIVTNTLMKVRQAVTKKEFWKQAHHLGMEEWDGNDGKGFVVQGYAYSKRIAGCFLEVLLGCLEESIAESGFVLLGEDRRRLQEEIKKVMLSSGRV